MSDELNNVPTPPVVDIDKIVSEKLSGVLSAKDEEIKNLNAKIAEFAKEVELIKTLSIPTVTPNPPVVENNVEPPVVKEGLTDLLKQREEEQRRIEQQKKILEDAKIKDENEMLKLKIAVTETLNDKPYLEEIIREAINEGRIKKQDDLKILISPVMEQSLKMAHQLKEDMKKAGIDPLGSYNSENTVTNMAELAKQKEYDAMVAEWQKKLNKR